MILDDKRLRFITLCAFMYEEIEIAFEKENDPSSKVCIDDEENLVKNSLIKVKEIIKDRAYRKEDIRKLIQAFPRIEIYYDTISKVINKHIKINDDWIPAIVVLSSLQEYSFRGYSHFEEINFIKCLDKYLLDKRADHKLNFRIAEDIVETLVNMEKPKIIRNKIKKQKVKKSA